MCGTINRPDAEACDCGHPLTEVGEALEVVKKRHRQGWMMVIGGFVAILATLPVYLLASFGLVGIVLGIMATTGSIGVFVKGTRIVDVTRTRLRELAEFPTARALPRGRDDRGSPAP